ncbi:MAG TPA: hypothetical protein VGE26_00345 [Sphingobacteriaceae bacterium]
MKILFLIVCLMITSFATFAQSVIKVPQSLHSVLPDGKFSENEWKDAYVMPVSDSLMLYIKQDAENIYWCLRGMQNRPSLAGVDFYITHHDSLINLHASAKLGERKLTGGGYGDWNWWNNENWIANVARFNAFTGTRFLPDEAKEFQLRKIRFSNQAIRLMLQEDNLKNPNPPFPAGSSPNDTTKWLILGL